MCYARVSLLLLTGRTKGLLAYGVRAERASLCPEINEQLHHSLSPSHILRCVAT